MAAFMCALKKFINILAVITSSIKIEEMPQQKSFVRRRFDGFRRVCFKAFRRQHTN
jgi:hypothetical protein